MRISDPLISVPVVESVEDRIAAHPKTIPQILTAFNLTLSAPALGGRCMGRWGISPARTPALGTANTLRDLFSEFPGAVDACNWDSLGVMLLRNWSRVGDGKAPRELIGRTGKSPALDAAPLSMPWVPTDPPPALDGRRCRERGTSYTVDVACHKREND